MSKTSIIGYPRVGSQRELKFWVEDYFKGNISSTVLKTNSADLRKRQWQIQKQNGIDFIPSNDFSYYDGLLDAAYLLGAIPKDYKDLGLNELDTYFAMARGYQGDRGDVKAMTMRKWFNTNYHYIVPILSDEMVIHLNSSKPFEQYLEAMELGIKTKPVLIGPFTFLMLANYQGEKQKADFIRDFINVYKSIFKEFNSLEAEWLQIDEPSLVMDLSDADKDLFISIYEELLLYKGNVKIFLQTYFGDIRDSYEQITSLGFDGIGLDFVEGSRTEQLIIKKGFPDNYLLFAGLVNGKNIWQHLLFAFTCSYTLENETVLDESYKKHFSYAQEKLDEICKLNLLFNDPVAAAKNIRDTF